MDPPKNKTLRASDIPRLSKLPVAVGIGKSSLSNQSSACFLPRRGQTTPIPAQGAARQNQDAELDHGMGQSTLDPSSISRNEPLAALNGPAAGGSGMQDEAEPSVSRSRRPRPSLSDRTVETLSQIPPSPSPGRRKSSFFYSEGMAVSPARPKSSMSRSRPTTSQGSCAPPLPTSHNMIRPLSPEKRPVASSSRNRTPPSVPAQRFLSSQVPKSLPPSHAKLNGIVNGTPSATRHNKTAVSCEQENGYLGRSSILSSVRGSKSSAVRASKPRQAINNALTKPRVDEPEGTAMGEMVQPYTTASRLLNDGEHRKERVKGHSPSVVPSGKPTPPKSSAALRDTIAKAKAARRAVSKPHKGVEPSMHDDFPEIELGGSNKAALKKRIAGARNNGRLNIAAMGLRGLPVEIMHMYDTSSLDINDGSWAESVDLVKLVAADNEISSLEERFFPRNCTAESDSTEDDQTNQIFGALEAIDLHGNVLAGSLPAGMANLNYLTTLNLSRNRLENEALIVIAQIKPLRELRLSENLIKGSVDTSLFKLTNLEVLDLSKNAIMAMPPEIRSLSALQTLEVSGNKLSSLPLDSMDTLPLREIFVSRNSLKGCLIPTTARELMTLKTLDISFNALTSITDSGFMALPALQSLSVSENRLRSIPDLSGSASLITLTADGNQITSVPDGLTALPHLKNVDLSRNDIRQLDMQIGLMGNLSVFRIANNPLRERRLLNLNTEDLKRELRHRHTKSIGADAIGNSVDSGDFHREIGGPAAPRPWQVLTGGIVDRASTSLRAIEPDELEHLNETTPVKALVLHHNLLDTIPQTIGLVASTLVNLDMSHNKISGEAYLYSQLFLPKLKTLNLAANAITTLDPILSALSAPSLSELNFSRNRLTKLPELRTRFSLMTSVFAADNSIADLSFESVRGLHVLDVSGNEINFLEPRLGLLGHEGLRMLSVGANRFRVPRRDVVEKGTESILTWLRSRIPDEE